MDQIVIFTGTKLHFIIIAIACIYTLVLMIRRDFTLLYKSLIVLPLAFVTGKALGLVINNPRPFVVEGIQPLIEHVPNNGFPSDHMLLVASVAALVYTQNKTLGSILAILALCVGSARVIANVHHSVDVLGSIFIACIVTSVSIYLIACLNLNSQKN